MKRTLPTWSRDWPWSLDVVRKVLRRRPDLRMLGERVGPTLVYDEAEANKIREAMEQRERAKGVS